MPRNNPRGSLLNAAAGVVAPPPGDPICVAYEAALEEWCSVGPRHRNVKDGDERKGKPRSFNDMVFDRLNDSNIRDARELPLGIVAEGDSVAGFAKLAEQGGAAGQAADELLGLIRNVTPLKSSGYSAHGFLEQGYDVVTSKLGGHFNIERVLFPDAQRGRPGTPIEIKRPTEHESHDGQLRHYAEASPSGECELVDCETCGLECHGFQSDCPPEAAAPS